MTIKHHLTDSLLMAYSAGQLPEAFNLVVATHLSLCDDCRARAGSFDAIGGAMLEDCDSAPISSVSLEATMARIRREASSSMPVPSPRLSGQRRGENLFPEPLRAYVGGDLDTVRWRRVGGGVRQAILPTSTEARVRLLHIPAGAAIPDHGHRGMELTLVLKGAFRDEVDRFERGDIEIADQELEHTPVAEPGEDCICLAATDAPLRFKALLPRALQSFLRI